MAKVIFIRFANTNCDYRDSLVSFEIISPRGARTLKIGSKAQYSLPKRFPMTCKILSETITHIKKCLFACLRTCMGPICGPWCYKRNFEFFFTLPFQLFYSVVYVSDSNVCCCGGALNRKQTCSIVIYLPHEFLFDSPLKQTEVSEIDWFLIVCVTGAFCNTCSGCSSPSPATTNAIGIWIHFLC